MALLAPAAALQSVLRVQTVFVRPVRTCVLGVCASSFRSLPLCRLVRFAFLALLLPLSLAFLLGLRCLCLLLRLLLWLRDLLRCFRFLSSSSERQRRDHVPRAKVIPVPCEPEAFSERVAAHVHPACCFLADFELVAQDCLPGGFDGFLAFCCHSAEVGHVIPQEPAHVVSEHAWLVPGRPSLVGTSRTNHPPVDCQEAVLVAELLRCCPHLTSHPGPSHLNHRPAALLDHVRLRHVFGLLCFFRLGRDLGQ